MQPASQRPTGVMILAIVAAVGGVLSLISVVCILGIGALAGAIISRTDAPAAAGTVVGIVVFLGSLIVLVSGVLRLTYAFGAWTLKPWAWMLGVITECISALGALIRLVSPGGTVIFPLISLLISGLILYYLFTPEIKRIFGRV
jgi:hypothetical protein